MPDLRYYREVYWPPSRRTLLLLVGAVVGVLALVFAWQALSARSALNEAADQAEVLQQQMVAGQSDNAQRTLETLQAATEDARSTTDGWMWDIGAKVPWIGRNIDAVQRVAAELDRVSDQALPPLVDLSGQLNARTFSPDDGQVNITAIEKVAPGLATAAVALDVSRDNLRDLEPESLIVPLRGPVAAAREKVDTAASVTTNADLAARLLPDMLGKDGKRRYLLLNQNNAEIRSTGGIAGSFAVIEADRGRLSIGIQGSAASDLRPGDPAVKLSAEERAVFPTSMADDIRDVNVTPDFPRSAEIASRLVERRYDITIDGAISIDPVALSYLLGGIGPVRINDQLVLDQNNAVAQLLHQAYRLLDFQQQDVFFADTTRRIFDQLKAGAGNPSLTLSGFVRAVEENRLTLWSARPDEEDLIGPTDLSGRYPRDSTGPRVGVFFSDAASTKMEYFLDYSTTMRSVNCLDGGRQSISTVTDLASTAPQGLPPTVTGDGKFVPKGSMRLNVRLFSPSGGRFTSVKLDGKPVTVYSDRYAGRNVTRVEVELRAGQRRTLTANSISGEGLTGDPMLSTTPGIASLRNDFTVPSSCRK